MSEWIIDGKRSRQPDTRTLTRGGPVMVSDVAEVKEALEVFESIRTTLKPGRYLVVRIDGETS